MSLSLQKQNAQSNNLKVTRGHLRLKLVGRSDSQISEAYNSKVTFGTLKFVGRTIQ